MSGALRPSDFVPGETEAAGAGQWTQELGALIGKTLAGFVSGNNQPDMSGDDRERIRHPHIRQRYDRACEALAAEILSGRPGAFSFVPAKPTEAMWAAYRAAQADHASAAEIWEAMILAAKAGGQP